MADIYIGTSAVLDFSITGEIPDGTPSCVFEHGELVLVRTAERIGNIFKVKLSPDDLADFDPDEPATATLVFYSDSGSKTTGKSHAISIHPNLLDSVTDTYVPTGGDKAYVVVDPNGDENPSALGWFFQDGSGDYILTDDTVVNPETTYYMDASSVYGDAVLDVGDDAETEIQYTPVDPDGDENPFLEGWLEKVTLDEDEDNPDTDEEYVLTSDTSVDPEKTYYTPDDPSDDPDILDEYDEFLEDEGFYDIVEEDEIELADDLDYDSEEDEEDYKEETIWSYDGEGIDEPEVSFSAVEPEGNEDPQAEGWFESADDEYVITEDETVVEGKTYYELSIVSEE